MAAKTKEVIQFILELAKAGVILSAAVVAPNAMRPLARLFRQRGLDHRRAARAFSYLRRQKLIIVRETTRGIVAELTEHGRKRLQKYDFESLAIPRQRRWDGLWRLVAFDIPEEQRRARDALRQKLHDLGFLMVQRSLWIHPYPCQSEVRFVAEVFHVQPFIWTFEVHALDRGEFLKRRFRSL